MSFLGTEGVGFVIERQGIRLAGRYKQDSRYEFSIDGWVTAESGMWLTGKRVERGYEAALLYVQLVPVGQNNFRGTIVEESRQADGSIWATMRYEIVALARMK